MVPVLRNWPPLSTSVCSSPRASLCPLIRPRLVGVKLLKLNCGSNSLRFYSGRMITGSKLSTSVYRALVITTL